MMVFMWTIQWIGGVIWDTPTVDWQRCWCGLHKNWACVSGHTSAWPLQWKGCVDRGHVRHFGWYLGGLCRMKGVRFGTWPQWTADSVYVAHIVNRLSGLEHDDGVYASYTVKRVCCLGHSHSGLTMVFTWTVSWIRHVVWDTSTMIRWWRLCDLSNVCSVSFGTRPQWSDDGAYVTCIFNRVSRLGHIHSEPIRAMKWIGL